MKTDKRLDARLVKAYQSGDQKALAALVKRWHLAFCNKAFWLVKDADVSKDIAQETWRTIISKLETLKNPSSFGNWALRIVYSKSLDVLRKTDKIKNQQQILDREQAIIEEGNDEREELKTQLLKAIKNLSVQQQIVIRLFYLEDYSLKEISKTLQINEGTAKSRLFYAREKLRKLLHNKRVK
ncbi:RNA polymerase sigma factor [Lacinutrix jangbogonensis]|uniref:RNA polymerase sigma factor n=1 Tax=Lacinutrix jangbogonensis TaxID=1469557 RepID=UPI00053E0BBC|nr:RNA polymerase sigma factor [Lacinutrix jangbogonensis]